MVHAIRELVISDWEERTNWQNIADMYVMRYAQAIQNLVSSNFETANAVYDEVHRLFQPYLNGTNFNDEQVISRCGDTYIPERFLDTSEPTLSQRAIIQTAQHLCASLYSILAGPKTLSWQKGQLLDLMEALKWTAWKDCQPACNYDEICFTAIWPFGTHRDHETPNCLNASSIIDRHGYW